MWIFVCVYLETDSFRNKDENLATGLFLVLEFQIMADLYYNVYGWTMFMEHERLDPFCA